MNTCPHVIFSTEIGIYHVLHIWNDFIYENLKLHILQTSEWMLLIFVNEILVNKNDKYLPVCMYLETSFCYEKLKIILEI